MKSIREITITDLLNVMYHFGNHQSISSFTKFLNEDRNRWWKEDVNMDPTFINPRLKDPDIGAFQSHDRDVNRWLEGGKFNQKAFTENITAHLLETLFANAIDRYAYDEEGMSALKELLRILSDDMQFDIIKYREELHSLTATDTEHITSLFDTLKTNLIRFAFDNLKNKNDIPLFKEISTFSKPISTSSELLPNMQASIQNHTLQLAVGTRENLFPKASLMTYHELSQYKSAEAIASNLLDNDRALYPKMDAKNAGTVEQWASLMESFPETFCFLVDDQYNVIGNWSVVVLNARLERMLLNGELTAELFTSENLPWFIAKPGEYALHIMNMSINAGYGSAKNWRKLLGSFWSQIDAWADQDIFFKTIYASCHNKGSVSFFSKTFDFEHIAPSAVSGEYYGQTLHPFPAGIANDELRKKYDERPWLELQQLTERTFLGEKNIQQLSRLIYHTDKYIYQEGLFTSETQALTVLSRLLPAGIDPMFSLKNCFVAKYGGDIIGLLLWVRSPEFNWDNRYLCDLLAKQVERVSPFIDKVTTEYFTKYSKKDADISILNFAVAEEFRGTGIGFKLLDTFSKQHANESIELYALMEDEAKLPIYSTAGFTCKEFCQGFSVRDDDYLKSYLLRRENGVSKNKNNITLFKEACSSDSVFLQRSMHQIPPSYSQGIADARYIEWECETLKKIYTDIPFANAFGRHYPVYLMTGSDNVKFPFAMLTPQETLLPIPNAIDYTHSPWYDDFKIIVEPNIHFPNLYGYTNSGLKTDEQGNVLSLISTPRRYVETVYSCHILQFELWQAYTKTNGSRFATMHDLPMRQAIHRDGMANLEVITSGCNRSSLFDVALAVIVPNDRTGEYGIVTGLRSQSVATFPGYFSIVPSGGFELYELESLQTRDIICDNYSVESTLYRELLEEVFGDTSFKSPTGDDDLNRLYRNQIVSDIKDGIDCGSCKFQFLGVAFDLITLRQTLSFVLQIDDRSFLRQHPIKKNDERYAKNA